jgi:hypothetical protein
MPIKKVKLTVSGTRFEIRRKVIMSFLDEEPGTGKGDYCSKYIYEVETLQDGSCVFIKRPAPLNKGVDFTVHVQNVRFREKGFTYMPSHTDIFNDFLAKKDSNHHEYEKVMVIINKIYNCENINTADYLNLNFNIGHSIEAILMAIKWLFIEQDVTYWNWSGRNMFYEGLKERELC